MGGGGSEDAVGVLGGVFGDEVVEFVFDAAGVVGIGEIG